MRGQALKGHLDLLLLAVIGDEPKHGYAVMEELRRRSDEAFDLPEGTVYPALHRLEGAGYLASDWTTVGGRRRRTYRVTRKGKGALERERSSWEEFATAVGMVLKGTPWPNTS